MADRLKLQAKIVQRVREVLEPLHAQGESAVLLAAVSGGMDSMVLLSVLEELRRLSGLQIAVGHVNHQLRAESAREAEFVERAASALGLECLVRVLEERPSGQNLEAWARAERYAALEEMRRSCGADYIATAHHQRDQAETILMRVISGRAQSDGHSIAQYCSERRLVRPLLDISHSDLAAYASEWGVSYVEDASNKDLSRTRNYLRMSLMPQIRRELNPALDETLSEAAERSGADEDFLQQFAEEAAKPLELTPRVDEIANLPAAIAWRVCRIIAEYACGEAARNIGYRAYQRVVCSARLGKTSGGGDLGHGISFVVNQERLLFVPSGAEAEALEPTELPIPGAVARHYSDGSLAQILALTADREGYHAEGEIPGHVQREFFDLEAIFSVVGASKTGNSLVVRERQDGDVVRIAHRGSRKLKKLFQERGVMLTVRDRIPIVELNSRILWVPGVARSEIAPVGSETREMLVLEYRQRGPMSERGRQGAS